MSLSLLEMAEMICDSITQFDDVSMAKCKSYLARRYVVVYDDFLWADSTMTAAATLLADTPTVQYPDGMELIKTIRCNGTHFLDPIDDTFLIESDPTMFERTGIPIYYDDYTTEPNVKAIIVYPTPISNTPLLVYGKRTCPGLTDDSDVSILRNCDNVIMAFAHGDMLRRQRQFGKANEMFQEAAALLKAAKTLETEQANQPRRTKNLTIAGNSLLEMTDAVCGICGQWTPDVRILVKEYLRRSYQVSYDMFLWPESTVMVRMTVSGQQLILPHYMDRVIAVRGGDALQLWPKELTEIMNVDPGSFDEEGTAISFSMLTPVGVTTHPPLGPELLRFASTSEADTSKVFIRGESGGYEVTEEIELDGTSVVDSVNAYDIAITVSKNLTTGSVTVNGASSTSLFLELGPNERERKHIRLWLLPNPEDQPADQLEAIVLGKRKITPLLSDEDTPIITGIQNVLINAAAADMFVRLGQSDQAKVMQTKAAAALQSLKSLNMDQNAYAPRIIPYVEPSALEQNYCWSKG